MSLRRASGQAFRTGRAGAKCLPLLLLGEAEIRANQPHSPAQETGAAGVNMVSLKRDLHPRSADLYRCHVHQRRQLKEPGPAARSRHLPTSDTEAQMSAAITTTSDRRRPAEGAAFLDVPAGADHQPRQPTSHG